MQGRFRDGTIATLKHFSYYQFAGTDEQVWDAALYARLAHAGFFTITTKRPRPASKKSSTVPPADSEPLAELQPFYSVVGWRQFEAAKQVRRTLKRLQDQLPRNIDVASRGSKPQAADAATAGAAEVNSITAPNTKQSVQALPVTLRYRLKVATDGGVAVWRAIDRYQKAQKRGNNWLTVM